ncbi:MAG TPA: HU family DNA-binding protein [Bacteroidales bacterium]|nr:HU family DNA-binding protein [Bacteroidales bacterium]HPT02178.1 HU family DNA-binding protein [Bacteroidales bacterium]
MAIKFKVIEKGQPGVAGGGEKKFYASTVTNGELTLSGLTRLIEKSSTVSGADIRAVLYAMVDVMVDSMANGQIVRLGELGSLRVSLNSEGKATADEVNSSAIKNTRVIFSPGKEIKDMLKTLEFAKGN